MRFVLSYIHMLIFKFGCAIKLVCRQLNADIPLPLGLMVHHDAEKSHDSDDKIVSRQMRTKEG